MRAKIKPIPLNSAKGYICIDCCFFSSSEEWSKNWDWSGPSCPKCGYTGLGQLANIVEHETGTGIRRKLKRK